MTNPAQPSYSSALQATMMRTTTAVEELGSLAHVCIESEENMEATRLLGNIEGIELILRYLEEELEREGFLST